MLHITLPTLHNWTKEGLIPCYKIGNRVLYKFSELEETIEKSRSYKFKR